jgi:hypothetical protein
VGIAPSALCSLDKMDEPATRVSIRGLPRSEAKAYPQMEVPASRPTRWRTGELDPADLLRSHKKVNCCWRVWVARPSNPQVGYGLGSAAVGDCHAPSAVAVLRTLSNGTRIDDGLYDSGNRGKKHDRS